MKNLKYVFGVLFLATVLNLSPVFAEYTVGYTNYKKIEANYNYAKEIYKTLDAKTLEIQQYVMNKDKEYKTLDTPIAKKNFEEKTQKEYQEKADNLIKLKSQKEDEIYTNIMNAIKKVSDQKQLDLVLDYRVIFVGGTDISEDVIKELNSNTKKK